MQALLFFIFVAAAIAMARKLANLGSGAPRAPRQWSPGRTSQAGTSAGGEGEERRDDPLADTLKAWVEGRVKPSQSSPPPLPVEAELRPIQYVPPPAAAGTPEPTTYPSPPATNATARSAAFDAAAFDVTQLKPLPVDDRPWHVDAPARATRAPRLASASGPLTSEANTLHSSASEDASDLASAFEQALAAAVESPAGPSLALSSSLTRPASLVYSACLFLAGLDPSAAMRAFRQIADRSRFFGLSLADPAQLTPVHLAGAVADLRRASADLMAAIETDLQRLDDQLLDARARPAASSAVERLRALLQARGEA
jgi:hypothetical protein